MDIKQLSYYISIVENNYNLTQASIKLNVSQPALSHMIREFEAQQQVILFERQRGRLHALTPAGEEFYKHALTLLDAHKKMMASLHEKNSKIRGKITVGIPPLVLSILFSELIPQFMLEHPSIQLEIVEAGAYELKKMLMLQEINLAVLLKPTNMANIEEFNLVSDELNIFMRSSHPLSGFDRLDWQQIKDEPLVLFNNSFMIYHQIVQNFQQRGLVPNIFFTSGSWDLLFNITQKFNVLSILPRPLAASQPSAAMVQKTFAEPMPWDVILCRLPNIQHNAIETLTKDYIVDYFADKPAGHVSGRSDSPFARHRDSNR